MNFKPQFGGQLSTLFKTIKVLKESSYQVTGQPKRWWKLTVLCPQLNENIKSK